MSNIYCSRCKKYTGNENPNNSQTTNKITINSVYFVCACVCVSEKIGVLSNNNQKDC